MEAGQSEDEIRATLQLYRDQLQQVEELLLSDPTNETYVNLQRDLSDVISLTTNLVSLQTGGAEELAPAHSDGFVVGARVEAVFGELWQPGVIQEIIDGGEQFSIKFLNHEEVQSVPAIGVRQIEQVVAFLDPNTIAPGLEVLCKWSTDGLYYAATVSESTYAQTNTHTYRVAFTEYGNEEDVPLEYLANKNANLKSLNASSAAANRGAKAKAPRRPGVIPSTEEITASELVIPEHLKIKPTDSEKEKERKRKKIKAIKNKIRLKEQEDERAEKQNDWQKFVSKGKKRQAGFLTSKRKDSIFASPDAIEGKVGVTGSGAKMTDFDRRKKFKTTPRSDGF